MLTPTPVFAGHATAGERVAAVGTLVQSLRTHPQRPILLGPWRSELGFEVLYWIPFLAWLKSQVPDFDTRAKVVTRGGLAPLYRDVACAGYDLYALRSVTEVRRENLADQQISGIQKQVSITDWDRAVMEDAAKALGHNPVVDQVHPAWMYWALAPWWDETAAQRHLAQVTVYPALPKPSRPQGLPEKYVAVKFYGRATFPYPDTQVTGFIRKCVSALAAQAPVIVLSAGSQYDDHADIRLEGPNIIRFDEQTDPKVNLLAQAAVLAHATAFVGTYGGMAQMALRLGVPSVSFWKYFGGTAMAHLTLSQRLSVATKVPFVAGSIDDAWLLEQCLHVPQFAAAPMAVPETRPALPDPPTQEPMIWS